MKDVYMHYLSNDNKYWDILTYNLLLAANSEKENLRLCSGVV